jgi:hypothetical protein
MDIAKLMHLNELARADAKRYPRPREAFQSLDLGEGRHFVGIVGSRGVGKTVLLKQLAASRPDSFFVSMDAFEGEDLLETAKTLRDRHGVKLLLLDEIHALAGFAKKLKELYDFLDVRVVFTSSVSLALYDSAADLSRRVKLHTLYPFPFREYLLFAKGLSLPSLSLQDIASGSVPAEVLRHEHDFLAYLRGGLYPMALEEPDILPLLANVREKILRHDLPCAANLPFSEMAAMEKTLAFIGRSQADGVNCTSISRNVGITKYKAEEYLRLLERAFLILQVFPAGSNVMREPKVLMCLPYRLLYRDYDDALGALREDFAAEALRMSGIPFQYLKSTRGKKTPDFLLEGAGGLVVEVGGRGKGRSQFKGVGAGQKLVFAQGAEPGAGRRALSLLGFLRRTE